MRPPLLQESRVPALFPVHMETSPLGALPSPFSCGAFPRRSPDPEFRVSQQSPLGTWSLSPLKPCFRV